jgi:hypothetical protein
VEFVWASSSGCGVLGRNRIHVTNRRQKKSIYTPSKMSIKQEPNTYIYVSQVSSHLVCFRCPQYRVEVSKFPKQQHGTRRGSISSFLNSILKNIQLKFYSNLFTEDKVYILKTCRVLSSICSYFIMRVFPDYSGLQYL